MENIILMSITKEELMKIKSVLMNIEKEKKPDKSFKVYSKYQVARMLGMSRATISKYVREGIIKSTKNGLVTEESLNEYLQR